MKIEAAPQLIPPVNQWLVKDSENYKEVMKSRKLGTVIGHPYDGADLVKWKSNFRVIDNNQNRVVYYMEWRTRTLFGKKTAYQIMVWSDPTTKQIRGYAQKAFFDLLFSESDMVCTDREQTYDGKKLWLILVAEAITSNLPVYRVDLNIKPHIPKEIKTIEEFRTLEDDIWSSKHKGQANLLIISKTPLYVTSDYKEGDEVVLTKDTTMKVHIDNSSPGKVIVKKGYKAEIGYDKDDGWYVIGDIDGDIGEYTFIHYDDLDALKRDWKI
jgi:hypothetical protein